MNVTIILNIIKIYKYLHLISSLEEAAAAALAMLFRLLSRKFFDDKSFVGLSLPDLPSSESNPNDLTGGTPPEMDELGKKLF